MTKFAPNGELVFSTFLGGSDREDLETHGIALDRAGNPVIAAVTLSRDFPMPGGGARSFATENGGNRDGFVARLSADGSRLLAATYLGGEKLDAIEGVVILPDGEILVAGTTEPRNFPVTAQAVQNQLRGTGDFHVTRLSQGLDRIVYATYFGGGGNDIGRCIAISATGEIATGGLTVSPDFPVRNPIDGTLDSFESGAFVKLVPASN